MEMEGGPDGRDSDRRGVLPYREREDWHMSNRDRAATAIAVRATEGPRRCATGGTPSRTKSSSAVPAT